MSIKPLICPQCGAPINRERMVCEYCGTKFEIKNDNLLRIETYYVPPITLEGRVLYPKEIYEHDLMDAEEISKMICGRIATELANKLAQYLDYSIQEEPITNKIIARGRVRVLPPDYRF